MTELAIIVLLILLVGSVVINIIFHQRIEEREGGIRRLEREIQELRREKNVLKAKARTK